MSATLPRERGAAVVSALIIVAIVAALTTSLFQRQTTSTRRIENEMARVQARMLLAGGIDWAAWWCATTASASRPRAATRSGPRRCWIPASSVPATTASRCSPARCRTNRASTTWPTWPATRAAAGTGTGVAALAGRPAPA
ncbi:hypothetical protein WJ972_02720 [Achromobacter insuavis]